MYGLENENVLLEETAATGIGPLSMGLMRRPPHSSAAGFDYMRQPGAAAHAIGTGGNLHQHHHEGKPARQQAPANHSTWALICAEGRAEADRKRNISPPYPEPEPELKTWLYSELTQRQGFSQQQPQTYFGDTFQKGRPERKTWAS